jgi:alkylation response protein AidB-like acyl-CoA dehydrogenase
VDLSLSDTEQRLAESVRRFVDRAAPKDRLVDLRASRAASPAEWATTMAAAGWLGLLVPTELGGSGATPTEAAMFFEEIGRAPLPASWLLSSGVAAPLLGAAPVGEDRAASLAGIASGEIVVVPAFRSRNRRWTGLTAVASGPTLSHEFVFVCGLADATHLLAPVTSRGSELFALIPLPIPPSAPDRSVASSPTATR